MNQWEREEYERLRDEAVRLESLNQSTAHISPRIAELAKLDRKKRRKPRINIA